MKRSVIFTKKYRILTFKCLIPSNPYVVTNHHLSYQNPPVFFTKTLHFKNPHVFSQNTSFYIKHLNLSNYKTCLYNLFVCLYTKNTKDPPVFFHKNTTFQNSSCVLTKHLNPSNYKTCLYNLFVYLYTKNTKVPPVFFHKTLHFSKILMCSHKTLFSQNTTFHIKNT